MALRGLLSALLSIGCGVAAFLTSWPWLLLPHFIFAILAALFAIAALGRADAWRGRVWAVGGVLLLSAAYLAIWQVNKAGYAAEGDARQAARRQLQELAHGMSGYYGAHQRFPPPAICDPTGKPLLSWRVAVLPFVEQEVLYKRFKLDEPWDSSHNYALLAKMPDMYAAAHRPEVPHGETVYQVLVGPGTAFDPAKRLLLPPDDFPGGPRDLFLVVEAAGPVPWTKPVDLPYSPDQPLPALDSVRKYGRPVLFVPMPARWMIAVDGNGSVHGIDLDETDDATLRRFIALDAEKE
jgi:hypothetical protein